MNQPDDKATGQRKPVSGFDAAFLGHALCVCGGERVYHDPESGRCSCRQACMCRAFTPKGRS